MHEMGYGGYGTPEKPIYATSELTLRDKTIWTRGQPDTCECRKIHTLK